VISPDLNSQSSTTVSESGSSTDPTESQKRPVSRFQPGQSGNPAGRPRGSKNQITLWKLSLEQALREQAAPDMQKVLAKAMDMAINEGHPGMIKLLLELHVSKAADSDDHKSADDKITININAMPKEDRAHQMPQADTKTVIEGEVLKES
jgi:uncharacterized protein DUF5681